MKKKTLRRQIKSRAMANSTRLALESRLLFDGAVVASAEAVDDKSQQSDSRSAGEPVKVADAFIQHNADFTAPATSDHLDSAAKPTFTIESSRSFGTSDAPRLIVADVRAPELPQLLAQPPANTEIRLIDPQQDAYQQIADILAARTNTNSLHIISAVDKGGAYLGLSRLNSYLTPATQDNIANWGDHLADHADIIFHTPKAANSSWLKQISDISGVSASWSADKVADQTATDRAGLAQAHSDHDSQPVELIFVDTRVAGYQTLVDSIHTSTTTHVILLDPTSDEVGQIAAHVAEFNNISAIHIISHGTTGELLLGNSVLNEATMQGQYRAQLADIGDHLSADSDILVYGCDFGQGAAGQQAASLLAHLTGADVAASTDLTGAAARGGDWVLESQVGQIQTDSFQFTAWDGLLGIQHYKDGTWNPSNGTSSAGNPVIATISGDAIPIITTVTLTSGLTAKDNWAGVQSALLNTQIDLFQFPFISQDLRSALEFQIGINNQFTPASATMTITFSAPVTNPIIDIDNLGHIRSTVPGWSALWTFVPPVTQPLATLTKLTGPAHFAVTPLTVTDSSAALISSPTLINSALDPTKGTAGGSVRVNGTFTSLTFNVTSPQFDKMKMSFGFDVPPTAVADTFSGAVVGTAFTGNLFAKNPATAAAQDSDPTGDAFTVNKVNGNLVTANTPINLSNGVLTITNTTTGAFTFTPTAAGTQTFTYDVRDPAGGVSNTVTDTITITAPANRPPVNTVPGAQAANSGIAKAITGISVTDPDGNLASTQLSTSNATLHINPTSGVTITGNDGASVQLKGTQTAINAALSTLTFTSAAAFVGTTTITVDSLDSATPTNGRDNNDSINVTVSAALDTDKDGTPNASDLDNDNDGILDTVETAILLADLDTAINALDLDSDNDGISDLYESTGGTGVASADSNNDGTVSLAESKAAMLLKTPGYTGDGDSDKDGLMDIFDANIGDKTGALSVGTAPIDSDGDTKKDFLDLDSDGDAIADTVEARLTAGYVANNGLLGGADLDLDGILPLFDSSNAIGGAFGGNFAAPVNTDGDAKPDYLDTDTDGDGILDRTEGFAFPLTEELLITFLDPDGPGLIDFINPLKNTQIPGTSELDYREFPPSPPVNTVPGGQIALSGIAKAITGISVTDANGNLANTQLSTSNGILHINPTAGVTITGNDSATVTLQGTEAAINTALASLTFTSTDAFIGNATITVDSLDSTIPTNGRDTDTINVNVVFPVSGSDNFTSSLESDKSFVFAAPNIFGFVDENGTDRTDLKSVIIRTLPPIGDGVLTLNGVAVTINQEILAADIPKLTFTPVLGTSGISIGQFTFSVRDTSGVAGLDTDLTPNTFAFNIFTTPILTVPSSVAGLRPAVPAGVPSTIPGISLSDVGNDITSVNVFITNAGASAGTFSVTNVGGATVIGNNTANLKITGTQAQILSAFNTLKFTSGPGLVGGGIAAMQIDVEDSLVGTGEQIRFNVVKGAAPVNVIQTITQTMPVGTAASLTTPISVTDTDTNLSSTTLTATNGILSTTAVTGAGLTVTGNGTSVLTFTGTVAATNQASINAALATVKFTGTAVGSASIQVVSKDATNLMDTDTIALTVATNSAPVNTVPTTTLIVTEDTLFRFPITPPFSVSDVDGNITKVTLTVTNGILGVSNGGPAIATASNNFTSNVTLTGSQAQINASFAVSSTGGNWNYTPKANYNGPVTLTMVTFDSFGLTTTSTVALSVNLVNDAPVGTNKTVAINEANAYSFAATDFVFTDPSDTAPFTAQVANTLLAVKMTTLPPAAEGTLTLNGTAVTAGQVIAAAQIPNLKFTPAANVQGTGKGAFTFQVQDNGGTANGGIDLDPTPKAFNFNITNVNSAPSGTDKTITTVEYDSRIDSNGYIFTAADFGFTDLNDPSANAFTGVKITTLPPASEGRLFNNGALVTAGQVIPIANIVGGKLLFDATEFLNGNGKGSFTFQVQDNGGVANGGVNLDPTPNTIVFNLTPVDNAPINNDVPIITNVNENSQVAMPGITVTDPDGNLARVKLAVTDGIANNGILTVSGPATITGNNTGILILTGNEADINTTLATLVFTPAPNLNGRVIFSIKSTDAAGNTDGLDLHFIDINPVNSAPDSADKTVTLNQGDTYNLKLADFAFSDLLDVTDASAANNFASVEITSLPTTGSLTLSGAAVSAGQVVALADIPKLTWTPAAGAASVGITNFTFKVIDDGGTADGGVDKSINANIFTFIVKGVNNAPTGADKTLATQEDTGYVLQAADFGFTDTGGNALANVIITSLPTTGSLTLSGAAVTAGQKIAAANIPNLLWTPAANASGNALSSLSFQVQDDGGVLNGGIDTDPNSHTLTLNVTPVPEAISVAIAEGPVINAADAASGGGVPVVVTLPSDAVAGDVITVSIDGGAPVSHTVTAADISASTTSILIPTADINAAGQGAAVVTTTYSNALGNSAAPVLTNLTIDTDAPSAPVAPDLTAATDTGISPTDNKTANTTPSFSITAPAAGETPALYVDGVKVAATFDAATNTFTLATALTDGVHTITTSLTDAAGNESPQSAALLVTIDTTPPAAPAPAPDLTSATDTGTSNSDDNTANKLPVFTIAAPALGETPALYVDGNKVPATYDATAKTLTPTTALAEGNHTITTTVTDLAGNESAPSAALAIVIDATPPAAPSAPDMTAATDTDNLTNNTKPVFTVQAPATGETTALYVDGVIVAATFDSAANTLTPNAPLAFGQHTITSRITDAAGNESPDSPGLIVVIDTNKPAPPVSAPDLTDATDSGVSNSDNVTNNTLPAFEIAVPPPGKGAGKTVNLYVDGARVDSTYAAGVLNPVNPLTDGIHKISYSYTDAAGNETDKSPDLTITVDTTLPAAPAAAPDMTAGTDTGNSNTDNLTNNSNPAFSIAAPGTGETAKLYVDGVLVQSSFDPANNTLKPFAALADGNHKITTTLVDAAGNESAQSPALDITVDNTAPATPAVPDMTAATDTGISNSDNITNNTRPVFTIAAPLPLAGETASLYVDGVKVDATFDAVNNTLTPVAALLVGQHSITSTVTDATGNESAESPALVVLIDTNKPAAPITAPDMTDATDSGVSNSDNVTNNTLPAFEITVPPPGKGAGKTVNLYVDGALVPSSYAAGVLNPVNGLTEGVHKISYSYTDAAGNETDKSPELTITVDTTLPAAPTAAPDMTASTDTGIPTDNITANALPHFAIAAPGNGETPSLYVNGAKVDSTFDSASNTLIPVTPLADGSYSIASGVTDAAGNESLPGPAINITINTVVPGAPGIPDMADVSDTGISATDNNTANDKPVFILTPPGAGKTPALYVDGVRVIGTFNPTDNTFTLQNALTEGAHTVTSSEIEVATGNESPQSAVLNIVVDLTVPAAPDAPDMTAATDSGASSTDNNTVNTTPSFSIAVPGLGETPALYVDGIKVAATFDSATNTLTPTTPLSEGAHNITTTLIDLAGNESPQSAPLAVTIDTTPPAAPAPAPDLTAATDTGASTTDNLTSAILPVFTVPAPAAGETPVLYVDGVKVSATFDAANNTLTPDAPLADGVHDITSTITDAAGNESPQSEKLQVTIDSTVPAAPAAPDLTDATDTGSSNTDDITNNLLPVFSISPPAAGETPNLYVDGVLVPSTFDSANNTLTSTTALAEGQHKITSTVTNAAGNESPQSVELNILVDLTPPPAVPAAPDMTAATDSGASSTDNNTANKTPGFSIDPPGSGETPALYVDGIKVAATFDAATNTLTPDAALTDGLHTITTTLTDLAGNESAQSAPLAVAIDTTPPASPAPAPDLTATTDTGSSTTDNLTSAILPVFTVPAPAAGETPALYVDGVKVAATFDAANNTLTPDAPLADGVHDITSTITDAAGNESPQSAVLQITIDSSAPAAPAAPDLTDATDTGSSNSDDITNNPLPVFSIVAPAGGETPSLYVDGVKVAATFDAGTNTLTPTTALVEGQHKITSTVTNAAGNESPQSVELNILVDLTPSPPPAAPDMTAATDSGSDSADNITNVNPPGFTVTAPEAGGTASLYVDGVKVPATFDTGTNTLTPNAPLTVGVRNITTTVTDQAGNESAQSQPLAITIDATAPTVNAAPDMTAATDTGASSTDNITANSLPKFTISALAPGESAKLFIDGIAVAFNFDPVAKTYEPFNALSDGNHTVSYSITDAAGNESVPGPGLIITVDTLSPATPAAAPDMTDATDTGTSNSDNITNNPLPVFSVAAPAAGETPNLYVDGVLVPSTFDSGNNTLTPVSALPAGTHAISSTITDLAGNESQPSPELTVVIDTAAPAAPSAPDMTDATDTGTSNTDNITNNPLPVFSIAAPAVGETPSLYVDGVKVPAIFDSVANTLTPNTPLTDGAHNISTSLTDAAGNESAQSPYLAVTIDAAAPNPPGVSVPEGPVINATEAADGVAVEVTLPAGAAAGDLIAISIDGTAPISHTVTAADVTAGKVSLTLPKADISTAGEGPAFLTTNYTDSAGNTPAPVTTPLDIDTTAPDAPNAPDMTAESDTGASNADNITAEASPSFTIAPPLAGETPNLYLDGVKVPSSFDPSTNTLTPRSALGNGSHNISTSLTDAAGNESPQSPALAIQIETQAPTAPVAPDMTAATDTGTSNSDNITNITLPVFSIAAPAAGETPDLYIDGVKVDSTFNPINNTLSPNAPLADGNYAVTTGVTDVAGNVSLQSPPLAVVIDTAPPKEPLAPDMTAATDTGASPTDNITANTKPSFAIAPPANGETPNLYIGSVKVPSVFNAATNTLTPVTPLAEGVYNVTSTLTDAAGNESPNSPPVEVTIDTTAPPAAPAVTLPEGPVINASEAADGTAVTVTLPVGAAAGDAITVSIDGSAPVSYTVTAADVTVGTASVTLPVADLTAAGQGPATVTTIYTDAAGNAATPVNTNVAIDTTLPATPTSPPDMTPVTDTGSSNGDDITSNPTPSFIVPAPDSGDSPKLLVNGTEVPAIFNPAANTLTPVNPLSEGTNKISFVVEDRAGNQSAPSPVLSVTLDTTKPGTPAVQLDPASDTGTKGDSITSETTPTLNGIGNPGDTITVTTPMGEVLATTVQPNGSWTVTPTTPLSEGSNDITVTATDPAGNTSDPVTFPVTISSDSQNTPVVPPTVAIASQSDTGIKGDGITSDSTPTLNGTGNPGDTITVTTPTGEVFTTTVKPDGTWSAGPANALKEGLNMITVIAIDGIGNVSPPTVLALTIDTTAPDKPTAGIERASDTGIEGDNITSDAAPTIIGTGNPGDTITVTTLTGEVLTTTVKPGGTWSVTPTTSLDMGLNTLSIIEIDEAGNPSEPSLLSLTITDDNDNPEIGSLVLLSNPSPNFFGSGFNASSQPSFTIDGLNPYSELGRGFNSDGKFVSQNFSLLGKMSDYQLNVVIPIHRYFINGNQYFEYKVPRNSFSHSRPLDALTYQARKSDGSPLPSWLKFNPTTLKLSGTPPKWVNEINVIIKATDALGHEVESTVSINVDKRVNQADKVVPKVNSRAKADKAAYLKNEVTKKPALSDQLAHYGKASRLAEGRALLESISTL